MLSNPRQVLGALEVIPGFLEHPFVLVDVGCSEGIDGKWRLLKNPLRVYGFDPLEAEVKRLNDSAKEGERYEAAFIVSPQSDKQHEHSPLSFPLTSAAQVQEKMEQSGTSYRQEKFNAGQPVRLATKKFTLDEYFSDLGESSPNFIKVDTDGADFGVLQGAIRTLSSSACVGVQVECQFHGDPFDINSNTFSNIDRFLRQHGFSLYRLEPWHYSRRALPAPFVYDIPGQSEFGPVEWAEAFYFKDEWLRHPEALDEPSLETLPVPLLLALALHGFPDVVAQIISEALKDGEQPTAGAVLDKLIIGNPVGATTYEEYLEMFRQTPQAWFPSAGQKANLDKSNQSVPSRAHCLVDLLRRMSRRLWAFLAK